MQNPLVSICIPIYNGAPFLEQCLDSAIGQTYNSIEIVIIDDGSADNSWEIVSQYAAKDSRIKIHRNEKNLGLVGNWNKCIEIAKGEWIKFLFQDDYFDLDCVQVMVENISDKDRIVTSGRRLILDSSLDEASRDYSINETLTFFRLGIDSETPIFITPERITAFATDNICINFMGEPTVVMFKKEVIKELGYFTTDLVQICDLEYFLRIATKYGVKYIPQPLTYFRAGAHKGSASRANMSKRIFSMLHMDPTIITRLFLFDSNYIAFRNALSRIKKLKLILFFQLHAYEGYQTALSTGKENMAKFEQASTRYPEIERRKKGNVFIKLIFFCIKWKRSLSF